MAILLRKRLNKRQGTSASKDAFSGDETSLGSSPGDDSRSKVACDNSKWPGGQSDLSNTPPPPNRKLRSHVEAAARNISPSQSLLDRYKNRAPAAQVLTESPLRVSTATAKHQAGGDVVITERSAVDQSPTSPESLNEPPTPETEESDAKCVFDGIEFEMLNKKNAAEDPRDTHYGARTTFQARQTRSQSRRQQRIDSHGSDFEAENDIKPAALTIRKVRSLETSKDDQQDAHAPTPASTVMNCGYEAEDLISLAPPAVIDCATTGAQLSHLSIAPEADSTAPRLSSYRKSQQEIAALKLFPPVSILPPAFNGSTPPGYLWVSPLGSSSRPTEPWGWMKKWTCCRCEKLDPAGRDRAAQTMVEQKICSRMECGHERCALGCRIIKDHKYDVPGVFSV